MEIKLYKLKLRNFKGIKDLEINFNCRNTNIYGKNATGKTTIFDAFKWLFFDKDSSDRKDFNIKTLDINNKPIHFLEHEVAAEVVIDGVNMIIRKVFQEKWVKKRGETQQEFAGHETNYWIDEVPIKKKEYEEKINSFIPESLFKLITDPSYFNNQLKWTEKRELLINISEAVNSDDEILNSKEEFTNLKENLNGRSIEDYKKVVQAKIKDLNKEKETIPVRIDELTKTLITEHNINYEEVESQKIELNNQLKQLESQMTDVQARVKENMKMADELSIAKNELNNLKFKLEVEHNNKYSAEIMKLNNEKSILESKIRNNDKTISEIEIFIEQDKKRKDELYKKWDEVNNLKLEFNPEEFICPTCKREFETEKKEELKRELENNFAQDKKNKLEAINKEGQEINKKLESNTTIRDTKQNENIDINSQLKEISLKIAETEKQQEGASRFDINCVPEYIEKQKEIKKLEEKVKNLASEDTTSLQNKKEEITEEINKLDKILNEKETQEKTKQRIEELQATEENISKKIQELESQQYAIEEFTKTKVELLENAINSKFEFVKFRLFDTQINGGLVECCDTLVNGVPYSDVNNAHKILAGLDIINTLMKFYDKKAPIFIDNRESINELYDIDTQIISLIVTTDAQLRIEVL